MTELTKITSKGQVVIPQRIRKELRLEEGSSMVVSSLGNLVLLKKVTFKDPRDEFKELTKRGQAFAQSKGIKDEDDVVKIIQRGRRSSA